MVSTVLLDTLQDPSKEINGLYSGQNPDEFITTVEQHFKQLLSPHDAFYQIPPLSSSHPPIAHRQRGLVRFEAMVQDTSASPEVYLGIMENGSHGGWGIYEHTIRPTDRDTDEPTLDYNQLRERSSVWAVTIPSQTKWSEDEFNGTDFPTPTQHNEYTCPRKYKNPSSDSSAFGVSLKLYQTDLSLKPGEVKTFVGILDEEDLASEVEEDEVQKLPVIHVVFTLDVASTTAAFDLKALRDTLPDDISITRQELLQWIADEGLGGDTVAAEWVLLLSLSKVQSRTPPMLPLSMTLAAFVDPVDKEAEEPTIVPILRQLLSAVSFMPLSLERLNKTFFLPTSVDEDVHAGFLQQSIGSCVIVSESGIKEGKVTEKGLRNLDALQSAIATQTISYVFPYSSYTFPVDLMFLVLTRGRKSAFVKTELVIPLQSTLPPDQLARVLYKQEGNIRLPEESRLKAFRNYLKTSRELKVSLSNEVGKYIEDEFVRRRQESTSTTSSEDLAREMTIAKLLSASRHESELTKETWKAAVEMDQQRQMATK
ncbi:hypothetical protein FRC14_000479 [Serendipita sp. 396]|nr:hypothetical protein FRC14_000479 [Serendipita sp. 396]KAG8786064.1 hypothetical protein FRC15_000157 [Serendipita sp. 397]